MNLFLVFFKAIARTAQSDEELPTAIAADPSLSTTVGNRNSSQRRQFNILSSLVAIVIWGNYFTVLLFWIKDLPKQ